MPSVLCFIHFGTNSSCLSLSINNTLFLPILYFPVSCHSLSVNLSFCMPIYFFIFISHLSFTLFSDTNLAHLFLFIIYNYVILKIARFAYEKIYSCDYEKIYSCDYDVSKCSDKVHSSRKIFKFRLDVLLLSSLQVHL